MASRILFRPLSALSAPAHFFGASSIVRAFSADAAPERSFESGGRGGYSRGGRGGFSDRGGGFSRGGRGGGGFGDRGGRGGGRGGFGGDRGGYGGGRGGRGGYDSRFPSDTHLAARREIGSEVSESGGYRGREGGSRGGFSRDGGSERGGRGGYSSRGGSEGGRGGYSPRGESYEGGRGGYAPRGGSYEGGRGGYSPRGGSYEGGRGGYSPRGGSSEGGRGGYSPRGSYDGGRGGYSPRGSSEGGRGGYSPRGSSEGGRGGYSPRGSSEGGRGGYSPRGSSEGGRGGYFPRGSSEGGRGGYSPRGSSEGGRGGYSPRGSSEGGRGGYSPRGSSEGDRGGYSPRGRGSFEGSSRGGYSPRDRGGHSSEGRPEWAPPVRTPRNTAQLRVPTPANVAENRPYMLQTYPRPPTALVRGDGAWLYDTNGNELLDFTSGIAVTAMGHNSFHFNNLLRHQVDLLWHSSNLFDNLHVGELCKNLVRSTRLSGGMNADCAFICNSGTEANEAAIKFARKVGKARQEEYCPDGGEKIEIVSFEGAFHGRTMGALSATPNPKYQAPFGPLVPGFRVGKFNDVDAIRELVTPTTAGVIVEPVQGESGIHAASDEFLIALATRCREVGAVLIYDEIQCGLGRTGQFWAHSGKPTEMHPDIVTTAKALGNGLPIGATIVTKPIAEVIQVGDHGTTFGGNVLASRVASRVVNTIFFHKTLSRVQDLSELFWRRLGELRNEFPSVITEIRGRGLMIGIQLTEPPAAIVDAARKLGLLVITAGTNTIRLLPPYVLNRDMVNWGMQVLKRAIQTTRPGYVEGTSPVQEVIPFEAFQRQQKVVDAMTEGKAQNRESREDELASYHEMVYDEHLVGNGRGDAEALPEPEEGEALEEAVEEEIKEEEEEEKEETKGEEEK